ncbi:MAG: GMC family oxidoreductase [Steroidobacteraceae bacterium]
MTVDYIIVGGGSSGCVLAARLSEDPKCSVLLIEGGPKDRNPLLHMPAGYCVFRRTFDWGYRSVPLRSANNRSIELPQGRVLGGSSSVNAMVYTRGTPRDFDSWATKHKCNGWSFRDVLPYFRRSETNTTFANEYHGDSGPLGVSDVVADPLTLGFVRSAQQAGIPYNADFNGASQEGCGLYQATIRNGRRCSAAVAYLGMAKGRKNLRVRTDVTVHKVLLKGGRAIGVSYLEKGRPIDVYADQEVILSAGAVGSPKLLMLSGIGPASDLERLGIPVVQNVPGVGQNLHDHAKVDLFYELNGAHSIDQYKHVYRAVMAGIEYLVFNRGPVASNFVDGGAFWWSDWQEKDPNLQFFFVPMSSDVPYKNGCSMNYYNLRPRSRGSITLASADPDARPLIDSNPLADPYDLDHTIEGAKICQSIMSQPAMMRFLRREYAPGEQVKTKAQYADYVRNMVQTGYHLVGTCKMGIDEGAVVGPDLRVRGVASLRVCDASIMPEIVSANTNGPAIMIGEKAADLIRGIETASGTRQEAAVAQRLAQT